MRIRQLYNKYLKVTGKTVTIKNYLTETHMKGYSIKIRKSSIRGVNGVTEESFQKSAHRATNKIFDIVECNVNKHNDYLGKKATTKFLTLTFKENITDIKEANAEFTKFNKRLSYALYKINKNVLKYLCVVEFQKRGAIHYHVIYFNLPFIEFDKILEIWGKGGTFIECIKNKANDKNGNAIENVAKYVSKYVNKTNSEGDENYKIWAEKGMLNQKRYFTSRGLIKPTIIYALVEDDEMASMYEMLDKHNTKNVTYENEFRGVIVISKFTLEQEKSNALCDTFKLLDEVHNIERGFYNSFRTEYRVEIKNRRHKLNSLIASGKFDDKKYYHEQMIEKLIGNKIKQANERSI